MHDAVVSATQEVSEDEVKFAQRITDAEHECCHVLQPTELLNCCVRGLLETTRERIQEQVRRLPFKERADLVIVRKIATAEGRAQCALLRRKSSPATVARAASVRQAAGNPKFFIELNVDSMPVLYPSSLTTPTTLTSFHDQDLAAHEASNFKPLHETPKWPVGYSVSILEEFIRLDSIFLVGEPTTETQKGYKVDWRNVLRPIEEITDITDEQVG